MKEPELLYAGELISLRIQETFLWLNLRNERSLKSFIEKSSIKNIHQLASLSPILRKHNFQTLLKLFSRKRLLFTRYPDSRLVEDSELMA